MLVMTQLFSLSQQLHGQKLHLCALNCWHAWLLTTKQWIHSWKWNKASSIFHCSLVDALVNAKYNIFSCLLCLSPLGVSAVRCHQRNDGLHEWIATLHWGQISSHICKQIHCRLKITSYWAPTDQTQSFCDFLAQMITFSTLTTIGFLQKQQFVFWLPPSVELWANHTECVVCLCWWQQGGRFVSKHKSCLLKHTICQFGLDVSGRLCVGVCGEQAGAHEGTNMQVCMKVCACSPVDVYVTR